MAKNKWALVTGADGGMGREITRSLAEAGYHVLMACYQPDKGERVRSELLATAGDVCLEVCPLDLSSMDSVLALVEYILSRPLPISLLMNNAGTMETGFHQSVDGFERTVSVNYLGPYLLTRRLLPALVPGARIVNMVSCTYAIGKLQFPDFFQRGRRGSFWRIPVYSNTKLALMLFTLELAERLQSHQIVVNAADPGIVSTDIITMHQWFDPLTDIFFRPFIRSPRKGASTAVNLLLGDAEGKVTGCLYASNRMRALPLRFSPHPQQHELWEQTEQLLSPWL